MYLENRNSIKLLFSVLILILIDHSRYLGFNSAKVASETPEKVEPFTVATSKVVLAQAGELAAARATSAQSALDNSVPIKAPFI
jgi:hypothetical protein